MQEGMASLRGSMLGLLEGDAPKEGEPSPLASVDAAKAAKHVPERLAVPTNPARCERLGGKHNILWLSRSRNLQMLRNHYAAPTQGL
eukprot:1161131-Pelagomonas_calceolata.AAC.4